MPTDTIRKQKPDKRTRLSRLTRKALRLDLQNGLTLCQNCHKFSTLGPHRGALIFGEWLNRSRPSLTEFLIVHAGGAAIKSEEGLQLALGQFDGELYSAKLKAFATDALQRA